MNAYNIAISSQADCIEIDVSRSSDGVLFALHDRYYRFCGSDVYWCYFFFYYAFIRCSRFVYHD